MNKKIVTVTLNPCIDKTIEINGFEYGGLNRVVSQRESIGGKGINCAVVLGSMGCPVFSCGITAGEDTERYLKDTGIQYGYAVKEGRLRTNYKIINIKDRITTEINEPGFTLCSEDIKKFCAIYDIALDDTSAVIISGSTPAGAQDDIYYRITKTAQDRGIPVILDADGAKFAEGIKAQPYCVKPNIFEMEQLLGRSLLTDKDKADAVKILISKGIKMVILSMGGEGAIVGDEREIYRVYAPSVKCVSTVGAGDSMAAAAAYCIACGYDLKTMAQMAVCAGTLTAQSVGLCDGREVLKAYEEIRAERIG